MPDARRIVLLAADGAGIGGVMDVSDVDNADTRAVMTLEVQTRCDLGHWHSSQVIQVHPWGVRIA